MLDWLPWRRRRRLRDTPLPAAWADIVERRVPLARSLDVGQRRRLDGLVQLFLDDKTFEGCGGLEMTDEIRVTIAAQACLLLVGLDVTDPYPGLDVIRVYPTGYRAKAVRALPVGVGERIDHRLGESSHRGYVVLSWRDTLAGALDPSDGQNVVLHEFAHQLDAASGSANGAPVLRDASCYGPWAHALGEAYEQLVADVAAARPTDLDPYGATNPAEFFAVCTEAFFERGEAMRAHHPELYEVLSRYFGIST
ncbi:MAG: zinc-dependent peptidase [Alphaproteobacteria bacterium]|nr:zinc-dependent peptidase [Alphaproteobacteria bacterium]MCB9697215.1 zinc-dependent peptidase [Alphaproteobacteria bacterium]